MNTTFSVSGHIFGLAYSSLESGNVLKFRGLKVRKSLLLLQNSFLRVCVWTALFVQLYLKSVVIIAGLYLFNIH